MDPAKMNELLSLAATTIVVIVEQGNFVANIIIAIIDNINTIMGYDWQGWLQLGV